MFAPRFINEVTNPEMTPGACRGHGGVNCGDQWANLAGEFWLGASTAMTKPRLSKSLLTARVTEVSMDCIFGCWPYR